MDEIVLIERTLHGERKARLYLQRKSEALVLSLLPGLLQDAQREISKAMHFEHGLMGYTNADPLRVRGQPCFNQNYQDYVDSVLEKYRAWKKECPRLTYAICFDRCSPTTSFSPEEIGYQRDISKRTVYRHLRDGFKLYLEVNRRT